MRALCLTILIASAFVSYGFAAGGGASTGTLSGIVTAAFAVGAFYIFILPADYFEIRRKD